MSRRVNHPNQFNLFEGERRRDEGIARVISNNLGWFDNAYMTVLREMPYDTIFLAEVFKAYDGIGVPPKPQCWGALTNVLARKHHIRPVGPFEKAQSVRNHGHPYKLWIRCDRPGNIQD